MLPEASDYQSLYNQFDWKIPARFNIAEAVCGRWARETPANPAIVYRTSKGETQTTNFAGLEALAGKIANALTGLGIGRGDRVALLLPQLPQTAAAHIAVYKMGAIAVPMAMLFGADGLAYRLKNAGCAAVLMTRDSLEKVASIRAELAPEFLQICVDGGGGDVLDLGALLDTASETFVPVETKPDDPALMIYTSGTTGPPKGALHGHRVLLGHLPGVQFAHEFFPKNGDMMWTPADWAWAGGLFNILLPSLYFGKPVVAHKFAKFSARQAWQLLAELPIRNVFIPPTALKMMRADPPGALADKLSLRTIFSGGEAVGAELQRWSRETLGLAINEVYGQTECNLVLESCAALGVLKPGAIGKPVPGARVAIIDDKGTERPQGETGDIAIKRPHPVMFLEYWKNERATIDKFVGDWLVTGDQGFVDEEGYFHFVGRDDDIITSSGYRIGPGEIEDCLITHEAVKLAAVVGRPDALRTEVVVAFVVPGEGYEAGEALAADIQNHVRTRLSAHEYPREIVFKSSLPLTTSGKIIRRLLRDS